MSDYFQKVLEKLAEDLDSLEPASGATPAQIILNQPLTCAQADVLLEEWYGSAPKYAFQFDKFPYFRALSLHLSEQKGCARCRQIYTDLSQAAAQASYALLQKLTATARQILSHSLSATGSLEIWPFLLAHPQEHPSYGLPFITLAPGLTLKPRLILPDPDIEPDDQPLQAGYATFSLLLTTENLPTSPSFQNFENGSLTLILRDEVGNDLWSGQSSAFGRDGRSRLVNVPLAALHQTTALFWALHLSAVLPPLPTLQTRPAVFVQIGFGSQELLTPLQKLRELYQETSDSALNAALSGTRQLNENAADTPPPEAVEIVQLDWVEQGVTIQALAYPQPNQIDYYDLQIRILDAATTPPVADKRRWVVQIEPDALEKETQTGQVLFEKLKLPAANLADSPGKQWQLFLWLQT